jgi:hypothetical protein
MPFILMEKYLKNLDTPSLTSSLVLLAVRSLDYACVILHYVQPPMRCGSRREKPSEHVLTEPPSPLI